MSRRDAKTEELKAIELLSALRGRGWTAFATWALGDIVPPTPFFPEG